MTESTINCASPLHPHAAQGLRLFNEGKYFEAHEALEVAWLEEKGKIRDLYRGILQVGVAYLHITRGNYNGAIKVHGRSVRWLRDFPPVCRGIGVEELRSDAEEAINEVVRLGEKRIGEFDLARLRPVKWEEGWGELKQAYPESDRRVYICDRCGSEMRESNCKVTCPNCGNRFDCSDLNIYFD